MNECLAWHRTGISVAALGVAVAKFAPDRGGHAVAAGIILLAAGLLVSVYGTVRYRVISRQLEFGEFAPATFLARGSDVNVVDCRVDRDRGR